MSDEMSGANRESTPASFDFDEDAISSLLDDFVETQTGPQEKHKSRPPDPDDTGAQAAQRTVFEPAYRHSELPLVGDSPDTKGRRMELLDALAKGAVGSSKARLLTAAGELCEQLGDPDGAVSRYEEAQRADARDVVVLRALRRHAVRCGRWADVVDALEKEAGLDIAPAERVAALKLLAQTHLAKLGDAAAAEQAALHAAELEPSDFAAWMIAANARLARGRRASAGRALAAAAERWPSIDAQAVIFLHAAELVEEAGETAEGKAMYERLLELRPRLLAARLGAARAALALGDPESAVVHLREAAEDAPERVADALLRTAAVTTRSAERRRELLGGARDTATAWTLAWVSAMEGELEKASGALRSRTNDQTVESDGLFEACAARLEAERGDEQAPVIRSVHPALLPYVEAWTGHGPAHAPADGKPLALASELERERSFAEDGAASGWTLARVEAESKGEVATLLAAEDQSPGDRLIRAALLLCDPNLDRHSERARRELVDLTTSASKEYPPARWDRADLAPRLDDADLELDGHRFDPLLIEHHVARAGASPEEAARLLRTAATKLDHPRYARRAAEAFLRAGLPAEAARTLRDACAASPDDSMLRTLRRDAELRAGEFARLADEAMGRAREAPDDLERTQAFKAMAEVDRLARRDMQNARLSLQSVAEARPDHIPTARALEADALRERDAERIRASVRVLTAALPEGTPERTARRRLVIELLRADPDFLQNDIDRALRNIDDAMDADQGLARQMLGAAYAKGDTDRAVEALVALQASIDDDLERAALALEAAHALREAGNPGRALEALNTAGNHPLALEAEARLLRSAKRWGDATNTYEDAARHAKDPQRAASLWREAACLFEEHTDERDRALGAWEAAARSDITYLDVYRRLAQVYRDRGLHERLSALTEARIDAGADNPTLVGLLLERATQRRELGDIDGQLEALEECLDLDPTSSVALRELVAARRRLTDWQGAAEGLIRLARAKKSQEESVWAFTSLGEIYQNHLDDLPRSEAALRRALDLCPTHTEALDRLATVLVDLGRAAEAARLLQVLAGRESDALRARDYRIRLSRAVELADNARQAEAVLEELRNERPTDPDVVLAMADYYVRQGAKPAEAMHLSRAANDLRDAIDANPADEATWSTLVRVVGRKHGPDAASCVAGAAVAVGHSEQLFSGAVREDGETLGKVPLPLSPSVDDVLAPPGLPQTARRLFAICEHAFDKLLPLDASAWRLKRPSGPNRALVDEASAVAEALGISEPKLRITQVAPTACMPIMGDPPTLVVGGGLLERTSADERFFLFARALKVASSHMAPALRARPEELDAALLALLHGHDSSRGQSPVPEQLHDLRKRILKAVPRRSRDELESLVLELQAQQAFSTRLVPFAVSSLGDRAALLLTGRLPAAVDALLKIAGHDVPSHAAGRLDAIRETPEALALLRFSISDAHFEARAQAGVDR
jgi:tetratricopeptide (TPR) repeat protein